MKTGLVLLTALTAVLGGCATPETGSTIGVASGPDLGNFVTTDDLSTSLDLSVESVVDQGMQSVVDLATAPHDLASAKPADMAMSSGCGSVTYQGSCSNNTLTYCYQNTVQTLACASPTKCTTVSGDSDCRYVNGSACGSVDENGLCSGNTLVYCDPDTNKLSVTDCSSSGLACDDSFGFADCE